MYLMPSSANSCSVPTSESRKTVDLEGGSLSRREMYIAAEYEEPNTSSYGGKNY